MSTDVFDPNEFKTKSRQQWDSAAPAWRKWWTVIEAGAQKTSERLVELAQIESGQRVLDIATGIGEPALTAARRVGPTGRVMATDMSTQMLTIARERAGNADVDNMDFVEIDAEELRLLDDKFDAALCRWGLTELPNPASAIQQIHAHLAAGGRFATAVWDAPTEVPLLGAPARVVRQMFSPPPPLAGTPSPFGMANVTTVEELLTNAGFSDVQSERQSLAFRFPAFDTYKEFLSDVSPMIQGMFSRQSAEKQEEAWQAVADALGAYRQADDSYEIPASTICVAGQR